MRRVAALILGALAGGVVDASEPGQPMDCSDWVAVQPGYTCSRIDPPSDFWILGQGNEAAIDNEGHSLTAGALDSRFRLQLFRLDGNTLEEIGHFADRYAVGDRARGVALYWCDTSGACSASGSRWKLSFDDKSGTVFIPVISSGPGYYDVRWIAAISGFARAFDIFQSYQPPSGPISFRVPAMPDGLEAADHFDTYWGNLGHPIDFAQSHPLECRYPAASPHVGDYLTVADPLPNPNVGTGRYYVTAATYQGQIRYGRKASGGHLSGRDPSQLPACVQP